MNETSTDTSTSSAGTDLNGGQIAGVVADVFKTGINAWADAQIAKSYSANNPSDMYVNGYLAGQSNASPLGGGVGTNTILLLLAAGAAVYLLVR